MKILNFIIYRTVLYYLPGNTFPIVGSFIKKLRYIVCRNIFLKCGKNVNIEQGASFGYGTNIEIGDNSGLGKFCKIPQNTIIGNDVMMGPYVTIHALNHKFSRVDMPMNEQGATEIKQTIIEDDVWIGSHVIMTPGRHIRKGSIIATGTVLAKDFPEYSIIGGNPSILLKSRLKK